MVKIIMLIISALWTKSKMLHNINIIYNDHQGSIDHNHQKVIDLCGTPKEGGTGLQNLRDCIQVIEIEYDQLSTDKNLISSS